jgi:hypothetical protein
MYFSPLYPMCAFIARDSPGMLVTVLDRPMMAGQNTSEDPSSFLAGKENIATTAMIEKPQSNVVEDVDDGLSSSKRRALRDKATTDAFLEIRLRQEELFRRLQRKGMEEPSSWENSAEVRLGYTGVKKPRPGWTPRSRVVQCSADLEQWMRDWYGVDDESFRQALIATLMSEREELIPYRCRVRVVRSQLGHLLVFVLMPGSSTWVLDMIVPPVDEV